MKKIFIFSFLLIGVSISFAQTEKIDFRTVDFKYLNEQQKSDFQRWRAEQFRMMKSSGLQSEVKSLVIQGNKIKSIIYNTGAISNPGVQSNVLDLVWNGLGYGYEFGPLVTSRVPEAAVKEFINTDNVVFIDTLKLGLLNNVVSKSIKSGDTVIFKIIIKNNDANSLPNIIVKDTIKFPLTLVSQSANTGIITNSDSIITYTNALLISGASDTITVKARIQTPFPINRPIYNRAFANYNNSSFIFSSFTVFTDNNSALNISSNIASTSFRFGDTVKYIITVSNLSQVSPLSNISITDTIHFPMKLVGKSANTGSISSSDSILTYSNPQLSPGSSVFFTILARIDSNGILKKNLINRAFAVAERFSIDSVSIVIDGFGGASRSNADGDFSPDGITKWGWLPSAGYSAFGQNDIASWGARTSDLRLRPKSWPENWYNPILGEYVYPSFLGGNSSVPDEEVYYVVDDSTDAEFQYFPIVSVPEHRGLGLHLEVRTMQFSNPLAEDIIFLVYTAENDVRSKTLPKVFFGMFGDPHIGGPSDYSDDVAEFIPARAIGMPAFDDRLTQLGKLTTPLSRNIVYTWDGDGTSQLGQLYPPGYFGYKFLESPNNSIDGIDNDDDGLLDESPTNDKGTFIDGINVPLTTGIIDSVKYKALYGVPKARWSGDENGDWNKETDDLGIDGIFGTGDVGEGNGLPDQSFAPDGQWLGSEPNFGLRDVNESDQIGLRSFWSLEFGGSNRPKNDNLMYDKISSQFDTAALAPLYNTPGSVPGDYIFLYGSGPFEMDPGHRERFSIALLMGTDLKDLLLNSETAQLVMQANYRFAQPPPKPKVTAIAGDGKVTLYWDTKAEDASDPFTRKKDFEGYKIYRSRDYTFKDVFSITDGNGYPFLGKALYDEKARKSAQWHRPWTLTEQDKYAGGFMPAEYRGRYIKYYMGEPSDVSGLRHEYVDSTVTNGITYYYAVVSFDHGDDSLQLPPSESQSIIQRDAVTQEFKFDVNTAAVVPNALGKGIVSSIVEIQNGATLSHKSGTGTGKMSFKVLDEPQLQNSIYKIKFDTIVENSIKRLTYSIKKNVPTVEQFSGNENLFVNLKNRNISASSVRVFNGTDTNAAQILAGSIFVDSAGGRLRATSTGILLKTKTYSVSYHYYPVALSALLKTEDANPVFDGVRSFVTDDPLALDISNSYFLPNRPSGVGAQIATPSVGTVKFAPLDIRINFVLSTADTNDLGNYTSPPDSFGTTNPAVKTVRAPFQVFNATDTIPVQVLIKDGGVPPAKLGRWDFGEEIIILTPPPYRAATSNTMMGITLKKDTIKFNPTIPAGTSYTGVMKKPFTSNDEFLLTTKELTYDPKKADTQLEKIIVVPNPYVIASQFEIPSNRPDLRADKAIQFRNLPKECTIRIYTIVGELVQTLRKNDNTNFINWDLLSSESARIGYGVYVYQVETPTGGTKIGRIGIIK